MTKPLHSGLAARNGVTAAMLAARGFTADQSVLEGELGFCKVFYGDGNFELEKIVECLSHPFEYINSVRIKTYPCCGQNVRPIEAMLSLVQEHDIHPEQVARVGCGVSPSVLNILIHSNPKTGLEGKFSLEFCLATALLQRRVTLSQFTDEHVNDPLIQSMIRRTEKFPDPMVPHSGGRGPTVSVYLKDGREYSRRIDMEEDQPWPPPTEKEKVRKFRDCAGRVLSAREIEASLDLLQNLEGVPDIRSIISLVCRGRRE